MKSSFSPGHALLVAALLSLSLPLQARGISAGAEIYNNPAKGGCFTCHGEEGRRPIMPQYPKLAGQNRQYLIQQMRDIKSGARSNGQSMVMRGVMQMVNSNDIEELADYLSSLE